MSHSPNVAKCTVGTQPSFKASHLPQRRHKNNSLTRTLPLPGGNSRSMEGKTRDDEQRIQRPKHCSPPPNFSFYKVSPPSSFVYGDYQSSIQTPPPTFGVPLLLVPLEADKEHHPKTKKQNMTKIPANSAPEGKSNTSSADYVAISLPFSWQQHPSGLPLPPSEMLFFPPTITNFPVWPPALESPVGHPSKS